MSGIPKDIVISFNEGDQVRASVDVLVECAQLQIRKGRDYQNDASTIRQADYYPSGVRTIHEIMHAKMLRIKSLIDTIEQNPDATPNFESVEDSFKDLINYTSFAVAYTRGEIDGQKSYRDMLNRHKPNVAKPISLD